MDKLLTLMELHIATKLLDRGKVMGPNDITLEFFLENWNAIGETLLRAIHEGIVVGYLHPRFKKGLLILLAKRGNL